MGPCIGGKGTTQRCYAVLAVTAMRRRNSSPSPAQSVPMQLGAMGVEPGLGAVHVRANAAQDAPEPRRVAHLDEMRGLVGREVIEHMRRCQNQPPRERQRA